MLFSLAIILGIFILIKGADFFVDGASSIAKKFKIPPIVIGLTIVAFGTSLPELIVSITSATAGSTDIALGNVVGSNIGNILLILGLAACISKLRVRNDTVWKEIPFSFLAGILLLVFAIQEFINNFKFSEIFSTTWSYISRDENSLVGTISLSHGITLLLIFVIFLYYTFGISKNEATFEEGDDLNKTKNITTSKSLLYIIGGLATLVIGGKLTVDSAVYTAKLLNVSESLIGLTIVAIGTSLPELVTSIIAATKKQADIAIGNVVGSNIFNVFFILGITAILKPIPIYTSSLIDILVLLFVTVFTFISLFIFEKHRMGRIEGVSMIVLYIGYVLFLIIKG